MVALPIFTWLQGILTSFSRTTHFLKTNILFRHLPLVRHVHTEREPARCLHTLSHIRQGIKTKTILISYRNRREPAPNNLESMFLQISWYCFEICIERSEKTEQSMSVCAALAVTNTCWIRIPGLESLRAGVCITQFSLQLQVSTPAKLSVNFVSKN